MLLFGMQMVMYDESGSLVLKAHRHEDTELSTVDTSFSRSTAGGTTRQCALAACTLMPHELSAILSLASASTSHHEVLMSDNKSKTLNASNE